MALKCDVVTSIEYIQVIGTKFCAKIKKKNYYINCRKAAKKIRSRSHILHQYDILMLVVSVILVDQTFCKVTFLENATNIIFFAEYYQISNADDLQKKSTQILPSQLVFLFTGTCKFDSQLNVGETALGRIQKKAGSDIRFFKI